MRAVAVRTPGARPELMDLPEPRPGPGEILVEVGAASVNPLDLGIAEGHFEGRLPHRYPLVLGVDGAGRVTAVGEGVRRFGVGDTVHGQLFRTPLGYGTFAEQVVVPEAPDLGAVQRIPDGVSVEVAAAIPTAGMTALGAMDAIAPRSGQSVLIVGATGGVGSLAVQLAAARGAEVIATARPGAEKWIRALGAAETLDHTAGGVAERLRRIRPAGVHGVLDLTRDPTGFAAWAEQVRDGGTALSATFTASPDLLSSTRITVRNYEMEDKPELLVRITAEAAAGRITVPIQRTVSLSEAPAVLAPNSAGGTRGKTVIRIR